jgi:acid phosphatase type 7
MRMRFLLVVAISVFGSLSAGHLAAGQESTARASVFLVKPYLQWGDGALSSAGQLVLQWQTEEAAAVWSVELQRASEVGWLPAGVPAARRIAVEGIAPHWLYRAALAGLVPGTEFAYRLRRGSEPVFSARARAPKSAGQPYRFVVFGDCAAGTTEQKAVAYQAYRARPDFVFIPGDIVYARGRISEYRDLFFPVYNADDASPTTGAPLLRSTLFLAAPGNHDIATTDLEKYPDGLAYFLYWCQPLNGPLGRSGARNTPVLRGSAAHQQAFLSAAGSAYPRMANFSLDYGNAHWTVLDANTYVDWTNPELRAWLTRDLAAARGATWRFVAFHQPGFNSSRHHFDEQRMRVLAGLLEQAKVDVVFSGHVHNYQRTFPLRFSVSLGADGHPQSTQGRIAGQWTLDRAFDGKTRTTPSGVIYLITGAGGAGLYDTEQHTDPGSWQEFTDKFISNVHSLTVADVSGSKLTVRQVSATGDELDRFEVTK